jgi:hypothetical protein
MEHPRRSVFCRDNELDRPIAILEAQIRDRSHAAGAIGDANFRAGLLSGH